MSCLGVMWNGAGTPHSDTLDSLGREADVGGDARCADGRVGLVGQGVQFTLHRYARVEPVGMLIDVPAVAEEQMTGTERAVT